MAAKYAATLIVLIAVLSALFPEIVKDLFLQFGGIFPPALQFYSYVSKVCSFPADSVEASEKLFTVQELAKFNGEVGSKGLYLSILGRVYDVIKGKKHYGPGGGYHGFAGRDASAAFATGDFSEEGLLKNVLTLSDSEIKGVWDWVAFYDKEYKLKGKLTGQFYNDKGEPTLDYQSVIESVKRVENEDQNKKANMAKYPPCNMEWSTQSSRVWCSKLSGGIEREWVGVPRKYYEPGAESYRCACIPLDVVSQGTQTGMLQEYEACKQTAESCYIKTDK